MLVLVSLSNASFCPFELTLLSLEGVLMTHIQYATMLGGFALNMTGPCFRETDVIKFQIDELTIDCQRV